MAHDHNHTITSASNINRSFLIGIGLNVIYVIVEIINSFQQNSTSLLSDAAHNLGDITGLLIVFLAFKLLKLKAYEIFTYSFKKGLLSLLLSILFYWHLPLVL